MAKQKAEIDSRLDRVETLLVALLDTPAPEPRKPPRPERAPVVAPLPGRGQALLLNVVLFLAFIGIVYMLLNIAVNEWHAWNGDVPPNATQPAEQGTAPMPNIVITTQPQPAQRPQQPQPIALPEPAPIAQPEQPAAVDQPSAPQVVEVRPTSEQYIVENGQFVLAAEPAPTVVPGSAGSGGSSGGSTWGTP